MKPTVAIITRTKDRPLLLRRAIESVLAQKFGQWHHVIVNDGGDPEALEKLLDSHREAYGERLQVVHHAESVGMQDAANAGVAASDSTYVCLHDDDDTWEPGFLEACVAFLEAEGPDSRYQGVIARTLEIRESIGPDGEPIEQDRRPYLPLSEISLFRLGYENPFPPIAFCYRRAVIREIGSYDARFTVAGDYDFNFRFLRRFEIGVIDQPLALYHVRVNGSAAMGNSVVAGATEHKKRYNEFKNHYLRGDDPTLDPALAVGLNAAKYLVELEWLAHEIRQRAEKIEGVSEAAADRIPAIEAQLSRSLEVQDESFRHLRERAEDPRALDQLSKLLEEIAYLNGIAGSLARRLEEVSGHQSRRMEAIAAQQSERAERIAAHQSERTEAIAAHQETRTTAIADRQDGQFKELLERAGTTLKDLAYLNTVAGQISSRAEELARQQARHLENLGQQHEQRAVDILREVQQQQAMLREWQRQKPLLQIGPLQVKWKTAGKRRNPTSESGAQ